MIRQIGIPIWFCTFSAADFRWNEILDVILKLNGDSGNVHDLNWDEKAELLRSDPVTAARVFDHRFNTFMKLIIFSSSNPIGKIVDHFHRIEFQQRGSSHAHCLFWVEGAPRLGIDNDEKIAYFIDKCVTCALPDEEDPLHEVVKCSTTQ